MRICAIFFCYFVLSACQSGDPSTSLAVEFSSYDFQNKTPKKIKELETIAKQDTQEGEEAKYLIAKTRLDWLLSAWLTRNQILLGELGTSIQIPRCSQKEEFSLCIQKIAEKIYDSLQETTQASSLKTLLASLKAKPGSAVSIVGVHRISQENDPIALRARLSALALFQDTFPFFEITGPNTLSRNNALAHLANAAPFTCPEGLLSIENSNLRKSTHYAARSCGYACAAHNQGRLKPQDTVQSLLQDCSFDHFGVKKGQTTFINEHNFLIFQILNNLARLWKDFHQKKKDPLLVELSSISKDFFTTLGNMRFPAAISLPNPENSIQIENGLSAPIGSEPYLTLSPKYLGIALWPTIGVEKDQALLKEASYLHPGKQLALPLKEGGLKEGLENAQSFENSLGARFPTPKRFPIPASLSLGINPEGEREIGKQIFVLVERQMQVEALFSVGVSAAKEGYDRLQLVSAEKGTLSGTEVSAIEVLPVPGADLAYPALAPKGFPGGSLIVVIQKDGVRAVLPPGLESSSLQRSALQGIARTKSGEIPLVALRDFLRTFLPQKLILAVSPSTTVADFILVLDEIKRRAPQAPIVLSLAPETGNPSWVRRLPRAIQGAFFTLAPSDIEPVSPSEVGPPE